MSGILLPLVVIIVMAGYPWLEAHAVGDDGRHHHTAQGPFEVPFRAGMVGGFTTFYVLLSLAAANDIYARLLDVPVESVVWVFRILVVVAPFIAGWLIARYARFRNQRLVQLQ